MPDTSPNSCTEISLKELGEFSEGILTDDRQQALLNHLPHCPACQPVTRTLPTEEQRAVMRLAVAEAKRETGGVA